jgi:hypothetical protein
MPGRYHKVSPEQAKPEWQTRALTQYLESLEDQEPSHGSSRAMTSTAGFSTKA